MSTQTPQFPSDPMPEESGTPPFRESTSTWQRYIAFAVDGVILAIVGYVVAIPFFNVLADLGPFGPLVGYFIALVYFAIPESALGGGQSIGKHLLGVYVVDAKGNLFSIEESILRYTICALPWLVNGLPLPVSRTPWFVAAYLNFVVWGIGGSNLYLLIFNRTSLQGAARSGSEKLRG